MKIQNANADYAKNEMDKRKRFKPKTMVGDVHKPNVEFTSDLVTLAHQTNLVKKSKAEFNCRASNSLKELRRHERIRRANNAIIKEEMEDEDLSQMTYSSIDSKDEEILDDIRKRENERQY